MKRWMGLVVTIVFAGAALAQAPFTIVRPADGAKVRETVHVQIPKGSLSSGNFVGVYVDGKFIEATILDAKGEYYEYALNTKASKIPDGNHKLELVKYVEAGDKARIMDRTSVTLMVANSASIAVPEDGFVLRYKWARGKQLVYNTEVKGTVNAITENQARYGGRSAELPIETDRFRYLYAVDNAYGDGDGLVRMQGMPQAGKDHVFFKLLLSGSGDLEEAKKYFDYEMHPVYMRVSNTGEEIFGRVPFYVPMFQSQGEEFRSDLFMILPMPALPTNGVKPGEAFPARFQIGRLDLDKLYETEHLVQNIKARGEFIGAEWESGHPCAKLKYSVTAEMLKPKAGTSSKDGLGGVKLSLEQTVFFAMDLGVPVKMDLDITEDGRINSGGAASGGGPLGGGRPGGMGGGDDIGMIGSTGPILFRPAGQRGKSGGLPSLGTGQGGAVGSSGSLAPAGSGGGPGGRMGGPMGGTATNEFVRVRIKFTQTLVQ